MGFSGMFHRVWWGEIHCGSHVVYSWENGGHHRHIAKQEGWMGVYHVLLISSAISWVISSYYHPLTILLLVIIPISYTAWWFQTFLFYFPFHIWDVILPIDEVNHFSEGWRKTTNQMIAAKARSLDLWMNCKDQAGDVVNVFCRDTVPRDSDG